jgi:hypothetical protein
MMEDDDCIGMPSLETDDKDKKIEEAIPSLDAPDDAVNESMRNVTITAITNEIITISKRT